MKAIRINEFGGPEVLSYESVAVPDPGSGEALVKARVEPEVEVFIHLVLVTAEE